MTFCTNCGNKLNQGATRCEACGVPLIAAKPMPPEAPKPGDQSNTDALRTQVSNPGAGGDYSTVSSATIPLSLSVGARSGRVLGGRYKLEQCIGSGGMGEIYRARRMHIGDTVAVKVLRPDVVENEKSRQRFYREARAAAMLHHPNAVVIHDFGEDDDGTAYIVMELLLGRSLRQLLIDEGSINSLRAYGIIRQTCAALDAGHRNGIVHRDIKPDNIILLDSNDGADHVKILDFGIAKLRDQALDTLSLEQRLTNVGAVIGTPHYMSPEQCQGEEADARSDIYALGVVLYELLTGVAPFIAKTPTGVAIKHVTERPRPLRELSPSVPETIERVVLQALEKDPNARPQTALELARQFETAIANEPDTMRLARVGEQVRLETPKIGLTSETDLLPKVPQTGGQQTAAAPPQGYETVVSAPSPTDELKQSVDAATDRLRREGEVATDRLKQSGDDATEMLRPSDTAARQKTATSDLATGGIQQTEFLEQRPETFEGGTQSKGETPRVAVPQPKSEPVMEKPAKRPETDPLRTNVTARPAQPESQRKKTSTVTLPPRPSPAAPPAAKSKTPLLIGAGAILIALIGLGAWLLMSRGSETGTTTPTTSASPVASTQPSPSATSAYPEAAAPEGMAYVLGGVLRVGRDDGEENERPAHVVTVKSFFIDRTEVTNEQYQKFIDAIGHPAPPSWKGNRFPEDAASLPVTDVTWEDASAYAKWAGKRLPTEEEWEFAARGTDDRRIFPWGEEWIADAANVRADDNDQRQLAPVGQFPKGASPFGLVDMIGNAWEWTSNDYQAYSGGEIESLPAGFSNFKVLRGGSYQSLSQKVTATLRRGWPASRSDWPRERTPDYAQTGFRCAQDAKVQ